MAAAVVLKKRLKLPIKMTHSHDILSVNAQQLPSYQKLLEVPYSKRQDGGSRHLELQKLAVI